MKTFLKFTIIEFALISMTQFIHAQTIIKIDASFYSQALDEVKSVDIYLPGDYYVNPEQQYAVIYYLHGAGGNQNSTVEPQAYYHLHYQDSTLTSPPAIFVCPDGSCEPYLGSGYVNSELYGNYEDYIMQDLIGFIETNFRAVPDKNFRFISGLSMGGFGSAHMGVTYPNKFRGCFPYIGFLSIPQVFLETWRDLCYNENGSYNLNYGAGTNTNLLFTMCGVLSPDTNIEPYHVQIPFDTLGNWADSVLDRWYLYDHSKKVRNLPDENELAWFLGCGTQDYMETLATYEIFMDSLDAYGIDYKYHFFNGGHVFDLVTWQTGMHWMDSLINLSFQTMGISTRSGTSNYLKIYPNPALTEVSITYELPHQSYVELGIDNLMGQQVRSLFEGTQPQGKHQFKLDASALPSGMYFCRLSAGNSSSLVKMVKR